MVSPYDDVAAAMILADDGVPESFARPPQAHGQGKQSELDRGFRVSCKDSLVTPYPDVVFHVTRLGHAYGGMNQKIGLNLFCGSQGQLLMGPMHRVPCLEGDHSTPTEPDEFRSQLGRSQTQGAEIIMRRQLDAFQTTADVPRVCLV